MLTHKGTQTIETPRLILRRAIREDAEPMFRNWASDPVISHSYQNRVFIGSVFLSKKYINIKLKIHSHNISFICYNI